MILHYRVPLPENFQRAMLTWRDTEFLKEECANNPFINEYAHKIDMKYFLAYLMKEITHFWLFIYTTGRSHKMPDYLLLLSFKRLNDKSVFVALTNFGVSSAVGECIYLEKQINRGQDQVKKCQNIIPATTMQRFSAASMAAAAAASIPDPFSMREVCSFHGRSLNTQLP